MQDSREIGEGTRKIKKYLKTRELEKKKRDPGNKKSNGGNLEKIDGCGGRAKNRIKCISK